MSDAKEPTVESTIQIALEAAEAANAATAEVEALKTANEKAVEKTDAFRKKLTTVVLGALAGSGVAMGLGALVYFKTISEMRRSNATQIEALTLFAESVTELRTALSDLDTLSSQMTTASATMTTTAEGMSTEVDGIREQLLEDLAGFQAESAALQPQIATAITDHIDAGLAEQDSRLIEALTGMSSGDGQAEGGLVMDTALQALIEQIMLLQEQQKATQDLVTSLSQSRPAPAAPSRSPAPAPRPNPFSYP